jgi:hypothetical protein
MMGGGVHSKCWTFRNLVHNVYPEIFSNMMSNCENLHSCISKNLWMNSLKAMTTIPKKTMEEFFKTKGITVYAKDPHSVAKVILA